MGRDERLGNLSILSLSSAARRLRIQIDVTSAYKPAEPDFVPKAGNKIQATNQG
jgi:hypothetical protein